MALFLAYRIMKGKMEFKDVPEAFKEEVKKILIDEGCENLVV